jgi:hypothetical protein
MDVDFRTPDFNDYTAFKEKLNNTFPQNFKMQSLLILIMIVDFKKLIPRAAPLLSTLIAGNNECRTGIVIDQFHPYQACLAFLVVSNQPGIFSTLY